MRLHGLDAARFLAYCGMVLVNFRIVAQAAPDGSMADQFVSLLEGRAAALFVVLAGVGLALAAPARWLTAKRGLFLFLVGMVNMTIFEADILHFYGIYFLLILPVLGMRGQRLLWLAGLVLLVSFAALLGLDYERGWNWETLSYADFWTLGGFLRHSLYNGWHPVLPWIAFLLLGLWVGGLELAARSVQNRLILWGAVLALAAGWLSLEIQRAEPELAEALGLAPIPPSPLYVLAASGTALLAIGALLRLSPVLERLGIARWLVAPGRQSLSLYVAHILIGMGALEALGLLDGSLTNGGILAIALGFCALSSLYAVFWRRRFSRGPLEALMRRITG